MGSGKGKNKRASTNASYPAKDIEFIRNSLANYNDKNCEKLKNKLKKGSYSLSSYYLGENYQVHSDEMKDFVNNEIFQDLINGYFENPEEYYLIMEEDSEYEISFSLLRNSTKELIITRSYGEPHNIFNYGNTVDEIDFFIVEMLTKESFNK